MPVRSMKQARSVALVAAGSIRRSFLGRIPLLASQLGPVKAPSYRVASRIVNSLRAGYAVADYRAFETCHVILVSVPEPLLEPTLEGLPEACPEWKNKSVVLCGSWRESGCLARTQRLGAAAASLEIVDNLKEHRFIVEGDAAAVREVRRLFGGQRTRVLQIDSSAKLLFQSGLTMATELLFPLVAAAVESLRHSGLSRAQAVPLVESWAQKSMRGYIKSGRRAWSGPLAADRREPVQLQLQALRQFDGRLAELYDLAARGALAFFQRDSGWLGDGQRITESREPATRAIGVPAAPE